MASRIPQIALVYDRHSRGNENREASVEVRITLGGRQKYISTGVKVLPSEWKKGEVVVRKDSIQLNQILGKLVMDIRQVLLEMSGEGSIDLFQVPRRLSKLRRGVITFIEFCRQRAEVRKYGNTVDSQQRYDRFIRLFEEWGRIVKFDDITEGSIIAYDRYLVRRGLRPYSKWNNYHRFLNSFILDAIDDGYLQKNPYKWVNIDKGEKISSAERHLTPDEFQRIREYSMPLRSLERTRDVFVFQTYTCMSYSDMRRFDSGMIRDIEGMKVYTGKRKKTGHKFTIPLLEPALQILEKYDWKLPMVSNVKYNEHLKKVASVCGIDKPISTHWARHTGATLLLNEGVDMAIVSKICGHSSTRITEQVYAKLLDETIVKAVKKLDK